MSSFPLEATNGRARRFGLKAIIVSLWSWLIAD